MTEDEQFQADFERICASQEGRRWLHGLLHRAGAYQSSYVYQDPHGSSYNDGRRSVALDVEALFKATRFAQICFVDMIKENVITPKPTEEDEDELS